MKQKLIIAMVGIAAAIGLLYGAGTTVNGTRVVNGDLTVKGTCTGCGGGASITQGTFASLPGTCTTNDLYVYTIAKYNPARCSSTNTWSQFYPLVGLITLPPSTAGYAWGSTQGSAAISNTNGAWEFSDPTGSNQLRYFYKNASYPVATYTFTVGLTATGVEFDNSFIGIGVSDGTKFIECHIGYNSGNVTSPGTLCFSWTNQTTVSALAGTARPIASLSSPSFLTVSDDLASTITFYWSDDINVPTKYTLYSASRTAILTPSRIGVDMNVTASNFASNGTIFHMAGTGGFTP